jgi:hypothetical protein
VLRKRLTPTELRANVTARRPGTCVSAGFTLFDMTAMSTRRDRITPASASTSFERTAFSRHTGVTGSYPRGPTTAIDTGTTLFLGTSRCPTHCERVPDPCPRDCSESPHRCRRLVQAFPILGSQNRRRSHGVSEH